MEIPSKYNPKEVESRILDFWLKGNYFHAQISRKDKSFSIVIPPPNVTGVLHMGHALNNTIQDVLVRFKRIQGFNALWMPGTDHAGIATQNVVEKSLSRRNLKKEDIGREKFLEELWEWCNSHGSTIINQLKRLGASCDWQRLRFTMDNDYSDSVIEVFIRLYEKGLIYRGNYIINWCPRCRTALSDEESAHKEEEGWLYYIKYPVRPPGEEVISYITVATTRPETMLGDTAIAVNPVDKRYGNLRDKEVILPVVGRKLKVIEDEVVDAEFGTGVVKVTPAHDPVDFILGKKHSLEFINIMNEDATLNENVPDEFSGMERFKAREALVRRLQEEGLLEKKEPYKVSAGRCYRCHTVIEPRISLQWFVKMKPLAREAIRVVQEDKIKFYPPRWKKVYLNWMHNIQDWCISRQIWWGHRIPVWYCPQCHPEMNAQLDPRGRELQKDEPMPRAHLETYGRPPETEDYVVAKNQPHCSKCDTPMVQDPDVLDTWFSSWLWPFATFYWPFSGRNTEDLNSRRSKELDYFYPTNTLVTASEILFFWVARMVMAGLEFKKDIPFRDVVIHGTVRDQDRVKMSKSLGNVIDPLHIIEEYGADALRFSLMLLAASGSDVYLSNDKFLVGRNFANKVWNATRFILLKIRDEGINIEDLEFNSSLTEVDEWIMEEFKSTLDKTTYYLNHYSFNEAAKKIYEFFWHSFCDWYIEIAKDGFDTLKAKMLIYLLLGSVKLLHPFMPFITEEIFRLIKENSSLELKDSLSQSFWPKVERAIDKDRVALVTSVFDTIKEIRNIKNDLGFSQRKIRLQVKTEGEEGFLNNNRVWIERLANVEPFEIKKDIKRTLYSNRFWSVDLDFESADLASFTASLDKKITQLGKVLQKCGKKLKNNKFLDNASPEVVEKEKNKFEDFSTHVERLEKLKNIFSSG